MSQAATRDVLLKEVVLKNFELLPWSLILIKLQAFRLKKRLQHRCFRFPLNIAKFFRTPILKNICKRLPLRSGKNKNILCLCLAVKWLENVFVKNTIPQQDILPKVKTKISSFTFQVYLHFFKKIIWRTSKKSSHKVL